jgi:DNA-directed RNA polymerase subunit M/transcription elongation factor TFIIS
MEKKQKIIFCKNCNNPLCKVVDWQGGSIIIVCSNCHAKNKIENSIVVVASKME